MRVFRGYQQSIQQVHNNAAVTTTTTTASVIKPFTFQNSYSSRPSSVTDGTTKLPGRVQPVSCSQAVVQQPQAGREITYRGNGIPGIPDCTSCDSNNFPKSSTIASEPKYNSDDPDDARGDISNPTHVHGDDSSNATSNDTKY